MTTTERLQLTDKWGREFEGGDLLKIVSSGRLVRLMSDTPEHTADSDGVRVNLRVRHGNPYWGFFVSKASWEIVARGHNYDEVPEVYEPERDEFGTPLFSPVVSGTFVRVGDQLVSASGGRPTGKVTRIRRDGACELAPGDGNPGNDVARFSKGHRWVLYSREGVVVARASSPTVYRYTTGVEMRVGDVWKEETTSSTEWITTEIVEGNPNYLHATELGNAQHVGTFHLETAQRGVLLYRWLGDAGSKGDAVPKAPAGVRPPGPSWKDAFREAAQGIARAGCGSVTGVATATGAVGGNGCGGGRYTVGAGGGGNASMGTTGLASVGGRGGAGPEASGGDCNDRVRTFVAITELMQRDAMEKARSRTVVERICAGDAPHESCECVLCALPRGGGWAEQELLERIQWMGREVALGVVGLHAWVVGGRTLSDRTIRLCGGRGRREDIVLTITGRR